MRALVVTAALLLASPARGDSFDPFAHDDQAHMAASYSLTFTIAVIARHYGVARWQAVLAGAVTTLVAGTAKELTDNAYAWSDQLSNSIGTATAAVVVFSFQL